MKKLFYFLLIPLFTIGVLSLKAQTAYVENLQRYWNYRYHLLGDYNLRDQHFTWESDYRHLLGQGGLEATGSNAAGYYIPATNIELYNVPRYNTPNCPSPPGDGSCPSCYQVLDLDRSLPLSSCTPTAFNAGFLPSTNFCSNIYNDHSSIIEDKSGIVHWDDQNPDQFGEYLMLLATEWKLLNDNSQSTVANEVELEGAVDAVIRRDVFSAQKFPGETSAPNGFFYRDDVPWDLALGSYNFGRNDLVQSDASCTNYQPPCIGMGVFQGASNAMMSKDNAYYILAGFAFITQLVGDNAATIQIKNKVRQEADLICRWIRDSFNPGLGSHGYWILSTPGGFPVCRGYDATAHSFMIAKATKRITGNSHNGAYQNLLSQTYGRLWWWFYKNFVLANLNPNSPYGNITIGTNDKMLALLATAGNIWGDCGNCPWAIGNRLYLNDHNVDGVNIQLDLINSVLNGYTPLNARATYENILSSYPCWYTQRDYVTDAPDIGWMLLFNLYALEWGTSYYDLSNLSSVYYSDLKDRVVNSTLPFSVGAATIGDNSHPVNVQAAEALLLNGNLSPNSRVTFIAPHIEMTPPFYAQYGTVAVTDLARMDCSASEFQPGNVVVAKPVHNAASNNEKNLPYGEDDEWRNFNSDSVQLYMSMVRSLLSDPDMPQEIKDDISKMLDEFAAVDTSQMANFSLLVYPNPFNDESNVSFVLPEQSNVSLYLYDLTGRKVKVIIENQWSEAGTHTVTFNRAELSGGVYLLVYIDNKGNKITKQISIL